MRKLLLYVNVECILQTLYQIAEAKYVEYKDQIIN